MFLHIDDFYKNCAVILIILYNNFPRRNAVYVEDVIGIKTFDEYGLPSKEHQFCFSSMIWLFDEGYLDFTTTIDCIAIEEAVLTETAFIKLNHLIQNKDDLPESISRVANNLAFQLYDSVKKNDSEKIIKLMRIFFELPKKASFRKVKVEDNYSY